MDEVHDGRMSFPPFLRLLRRVRRRSGFTRGAKPPVPIDLSGVWTVATPAALYADPEHPRGLESDPGIPTPPPDFGSCELEGWHSERRDVPGCWEEWGWPKRLEGPVWFVRDFEWPADGGCDVSRGVAALDGAVAPYASGETVIRFEGVGYFCHVWLNGVHLATHRGLWTPFEAATGDALRRGRNTVAVEVFKPWKRHFPIESSLAGFIPYVTTSFGGIWKPVSILRLPPLRLRDVYVYPSRDRSELRLEIAIENTFAQNRRITLRTRVGAHEASRTITVGPGVTRWEESISSRGLEPWTPSNPRLYELEATISGAGVVDSRATTFGVRMLDAVGRRLRLNGSPIYLRGVLHWMSYTDRIAPRWDPRRHPAEIEHIRSLGFNMIKQCLVVPPDEYLDYADRTGMLVWIELPMWMPRVDADFRRRAVAEYTEIVRRLRNHPSVIMWTLGCELDAAADGEFLRRLYRTVKELIPGSPLLRDNSGSAEAYGGVELEISDYYDYHFYAEANRFSSLIDHFLPGWRRAKPLVFGEYCDSDTLRNVVDVRREIGVDRLWWTSGDPAVNPQGVRWDMSVVEHERKIPEISLPCSWGEAAARSVRRSVEYRNLIFERTRMDPRVSGYVVTNMIDTPISTAGLLDTLGRPKFSAADFAGVNGEVALMLECERRRIWARGGDRPQHIDARNIRQCRPSRFRIVVSNFGVAPIAAAALRVAVSVPGDSEATVPVDCACTTVGRGETALLGSFEWTPPERQAVYPAVVRAWIVASKDIVVRNSWELWAFPEEERPIPSLCVLNPPGPLGEELVEDASADVAAARDSAADAAASVALTDRLDGEVARRFAAGEPTLVIVERHDPRFTIPSPFWREGVPYVADESLFAALPHHGYAGAQFLGVTPDLALDRNRVDRLLGERGRSVVHRVDARTLDESSYWMEWGSDPVRLIVTTFRLLGENGVGPVGMDAHVLGGYLFRAALRLLEPAVSDTRRGPVQRPGGT